MDAAFIVDAILVLAIIASFISGWRRGALTSILSTVGIVAGLIVGLAVAPALVNAAEALAFKLAILLVVVLIFAAMGSSVGVIVGSRLRDRARWRSTQVVDSVVGSVFQAVAVALVVWFISIPLASAVPGKVGDGIRQSAVLGAFNAAAPAGAEQLPARLAALLNESGLPPLVSPFAPTVGQQVDAPDPDVVDVAMVEQARPSVVHVMGDAESCSRKLMGSGFVAADDYVITNAHVVAGTGAVDLDTVLGVKSAEVVYYNPDVDIAVLRAPGLGLDPLPFADAGLGAGDDAVVMGYPRSGPFEAAPARIRSRINIAGPDIYATGRVEREAYTLRGNIRQGNSGGPLLTPTGDVAGVIFGASVDSSDTGYALTTDQVLSVVGPIADLRGLTAPVDTGACVAG
ncbi:Colicin V production protein [Corynebacterium mycetoides]|uniref:Colicin V production protein n=1 Tax=Corynebacterium mycetoides TaxID=38302 RepID=A0A1G9Q5C8_9CORY|nr:MarP family serine protease [Corynebacterium mycetoides]SDM06206.1 Colicin V production protein [Corynebacterium mycetoides]